MLPAVVIFFLGTLKTVGRFFDAVVEYVGETEQDRSGDVTFGQFVHHFAKVNADIVFARTNVSVTQFVDAEIVHAPAFDVVEFFGVFNTPFSHRADRICGKGEFVG